jgi:hypothetical protein
MSSALVWQACEVCSRMFPTPASYRRLCPPCWKKTHGIELHTTDEALDLALTRISELDKQLSALAHAQAQPAAPSGPGLSPARVRALLALCHPDRHQGSAKATEVTRWLLSLPRTP